jgi:hypothetical protein
LHGVILHHNRTEAKKIGYFCPNRQNGALTRIIHEPEKLTGSGVFVIRMPPKTIVCLADDAPQPAGQASLEHFTSVG